MTGQRAKVIAFPSGEAIPPNIKLAAGCLGPVQIPPPGNMGLAAALGSSLGMTQEESSWEKMCLRVASEDVMPPLSLWPGASSDVPSAIKPEVGSWFPVIRVHLESRRGPQVHIP